MDKIIHASLNIQPATRYIAYGTAGFRTLASDLPMVFFRTGLVALLRAHETQKFIGIMVTASHNPIHDNGLKIVDSNGEMLPISWEKFTEEVANTQDLVGMLSERWPSNINGTVLVGADNRPSSSGLVDCIKTAVAAAGGAVHDFGVVTTPEFHYLVYKSNLSGIFEPTDVYIDYLRSKASALFNNFPGGEHYERTLELDCAGGVGMDVMKILNYPWINLYNLDPAHLNTHCGAEYAHKDRKLPRSMPIGNKCASFDGDADRLVYYYGKEDLEVLGGERLTVLYAAALNKLMSQEGVQGKITVVTTGYSNSASINYLKDQGINCVIVPTGVKYLHEEAHKHEISIYFESNGHGTMLHHSDKLEEFKAQNAENVANFLALANRTVGDAAADLFLAEVSLRIMDWSLNDWLNVYQDIPNLMVAVRTPMKDLIKNSWDQMEILEPVDFARNVSEIINKYAESKARTLIRPSGTEPIVRIYVEAVSLDLCKQIIAEISKFL